LDIPLLAVDFLKCFSRKNDRRIDGLSKDALSLLMNYSWPGNVRELKNVIERAVVLKCEGTVTARDLPQNLKSPPANLSMPAVEISEEGISLNTAVTEFEKTLIVQTLEKTKWVKNQAAKLLRVNRTTLVEKIKRHQLEPQSL
jgi:DNA-binding NtrC family response regulator